MIDNEIMKEKLMVEFFAQLANPMTALGNTLWKHAKEFNPNIDRFAQLQDKLDCLPIEKVNAIFDDLNDAANQILIAEMTNKTVAAVNELLGVDND